MPDKTDKGLIGMITNAFLLNKLKHTGQCQKTFKIENLKLINQNEFSSFWCYSWETFHFINNIKIPSEKKREREKADSVKKEFLHCQRNA